MRLAVLEAGVQMKDPSRACAVMFRFVSTLNNLPLNDRHIKRSKP